MLYEIELRTISPYTLAKLARITDKNKFRSILEGIPLHEHREYWALLGFMAKKLGYTDQEVEKFFLGIQAGIALAE